MADSQSEFFTEIKKEFKDIGSKVNKMFDELVKGKDGERSFPAYVDIFENESTFYYVFDLPGFQKSDVSLQIRDNQLEIKGSRKRQENEKMKFHVNERAFGSFERTFAIPNGVDQSGIKAKFDETGILTISFPKETIEVEETTEINID